MAASEHIDVARSGSAAVARWRERNPETRLDLRAADLRDADLRGTDLDEADLRHAMLTGARLDGAQLCCADLRHADLGRTSMVGSTAACAHFQDAILTSALLCGTQLADADLRGADLTMAIVRGAMLQGTRLDHARMWNTLFASVDLSQARGLDRVRHLGPSDLCNTTVPDGNDAFLLGTGNAGKDAPINGCYVSSAIADDGFTTQLCRDLRARGVPVWRWREDDAIGDRPSPRAGDRVMVVLSRAALRSPGVLRDLERALTDEDERQAGGSANEVLAPVRIDNAPFSWDHERRDELLARANDLSAWREPAQYGVALVDLVHALRTGAVQRELQRA